MKSVKAAGSESDDELTSGTRASSDQSGPAPPLDPSQLGVRISPDLAAASSSSLDQPVPASAVQPIKSVAAQTQREAAAARQDQAEHTPEEHSSSGQDADDELETTETLGQLNQRHRRVQPMPRMVLPSPSYLAWHESFGDSLLWHAGDETP